MRIRFRRSPYLVSYWKGERLAVRNYATGAVVAIPAAICEVLDFFDDWRSAEEFARPSFPLSDARRLIAALVKTTLLQRSDARVSARERAISAWDAWNPEAGFFHMATRDVRFGDPIEGDRALRRKARTTPLPSSIKRYPGVRSHPLPRVAARDEFTRVLLARRTWRQFAKRPLDLASLGALLGLTGGVQQWASLRGQGDVPLKTSPSGGGRHPIELYVFARNVKTLPPGLYHYSADRHRLELLVRHRRRVPVERYLPTQFWYEGAAAVVFFTAVFARYLWKYSYPRAYRATLIEAGHQCQTFCLAATWLDLAPFCSMALADSRIEKDLGLDGVSESVLYAAGVGVRPAGSAVRSKPAGFPPLRVRPNRNVMAT